MNKFKVLGMIALVLLVGLTACGPKDATIQENVNKLLTEGMTATVNDGVVTLDGEVKDMNMATSKLPAIMEVKGVKSVENNCTVAEPAPTEIIVPEVNSELEAKVKDALKDFPGVEHVLTDGQIELSGEIAKAKLVPLMQMLQGMGLKVNSTNLVKKIIMALQDKYNEVIEMAKYYKVEGLAIEEKNGALHISGKTNNWVKTKLWDTYGKIDPDFAAGDMVLNLDAPELDEDTKVRIDTASSNLNIRRGPSTEEDVVGKAAHKEIVTLVDQTNEQWWEIRTDEGEQGYAYTQYLTPLKNNEEDKNTLL